ncbi:MAG: 2-oxo acid dehydrogenase subunit E2 [Deltaproteobacteria bacterium]|nr:MAG: 2-oxo acid dehydrogenase subunit E2 [Deltaproteobacteria bacterium]
MIEITIPKLGLTMENAKVVEWKFISGDAVKKGDTVLIIETEKVSFEVPSPADGIIHPIVSEGSICAVEEIVGYVAQDREEYERLVTKYPTVDSSMDRDEGALRPPETPPSLLAGNDAPGDRSKLRIKASPLARAMAASHNLNLAAIEGSGPGGRIVRADILRAIEQQHAAFQRELPAPPGPLDLYDRQSIEKEIMESVPFRGIRKAISDNMYQSLSQSAQLTLHTEAGAGALIDLRERLSTSERKVSFNAILVKIAAMALRQHPRLNATLQGDAILVWKQIHIGIAMEAKDALIVPVTRNPDLKSIREIDEEITELVAKTRENRLSPDDMSNGTFTISNLGFADIDHFTPIIRPPESAILGVGRITRKPVVQGDQVVPEPRIGLSLTFDHRIIDGAPAARFLKTIREMIEEPVLMVC